MNDSAVWMRTLGLAVVCLVLGGCAAPAAPTQKIMAGSVSEPPKRFVTMFTGAVPASAVESLGHQRPAEDILWPVSQVGFLFNITSKPTAMEVLLDTGGLSTQPEWMIMLHSHKAHGTNTYVEHVSPWTKGLRTCIRVPEQDVAAGTWQVMVHTRNVAQGRYTMYVSTWGAAGRVLEDRHGHRAEDGPFQVDRHPVDGCLSRDIPKPDA